MAENKKIRVAIYVRVSTLDQARDGYSLAAQTAALTDWCTRNGTEYKIYEDAGISGKDLAHRQAVKEMLRDVAAGNHDLILVWALSRLTRSVADLYSIYLELQQHKCELRSYTEPFDTSTPVGRAMMGICGVFAQMERELTAERVKVAMAERAAQGKRTCGEVLGYDLDGDSLKINQDEAERVRFIFNSFQEQKNLSSVARLCEERGYRGKRGRRFKAQHIKVIHSRPVYAGYYSFCGRMYHGNFEPIIPQGQWEEVQRILKTATRRLAAENEHSIFSSLPERQP